MDSMDWWVYRLTQERRTYRILMLIRRNMAPLIGVDNSGTNETG